MYVIIARRLVPHRKDVSTKPLPQLYSEVSENFKQLKIGLGLLAKLNFIIGPIIWTKSKILFIYFNRKQNINPDTLKLN